MLQTESATPGPKCPDLSADILTNLDFKGVDLTGKDLSGKDFSGSDFTGADLSKARLTGSILQRCQFRGTKLAGTNLVGADLTGSDFTECEAQRAIFGQCELENSIFFGADLSGSTFSGSNLTGADLRAAEMEGIRLLDTTLTMVDFSRSRMRRADLTGASVSQATFQEADLSEATLRGLRDYNEADWVNTAINGIEFSGAYLVRRCIMDQNYLYEFRNSDRSHEILYQIWRATSDCGRSFVRWGFLTAVVAAVFGILFTQVDVDYGDHQTVLSPLYFSVVTLTTLGYGDVLPASLAAQILVLIEVVVGYVMLGGVLSIFATRMGRRAD